MDAGQIAKKIEAFEFPLFPQVLVRVSEVSADEHAGAQDLAEVILKDPSLTTKILSVANSAYYGFYGRVSTITQSIVVLGFDSVKHIAFGLAAYQSLSRLARGRTLQQFWEHSLATGVCAELLAEKLGCCPTEEAFVGGLIHDVGKLMLVQLCPDEYGEVERVIAEHDAYSHAAEASILGITHGEVGRMMARKWGLPDSLCNVLANHHKKEWGKDMLTDIVSFSDFMIQMLPDSRQGEKLERMINMGASVLNLKKESINGVVQILAERLEEYCGIFEIRIENMMAYTRLVQEQSDRLEKSAASPPPIPQETGPAILFEISDALAKGQPQKEILQMVLEGILRTEGASTAALFALDSAASVVRGRFGLGKNAMGLCTAFARPLEDPHSIVAGVTRTGRERFIENAAELPAEAADRELLAELSVTSACVVPLAFQGQARGALLVGWDELRAKQGVQQLQTLVQFAGHAALALDAAESSGPPAAVSRRRSRLPLDLD